MSPPTLRSVLSARSLGSATPRPSKNGRVDDSKFWDLALAFDTRMTGKGYAGWAPLVLGAKVNGVVWCSLDQMLGIDAYPKHLKSGDPDVYKLKGLTVERFKNVPWVHFGPWKTEEDGGHRLPKTYFEGVTNNTSRIVSRFHPQKVQEFLRTLSAAALPAPPPAPASASPAPPAPPPVQHPRALCDGIGPPLVTPLPDGWRKCIAACTVSLADARTSEAPPDVPPDVCGFVDWKFPLYLRWKDDHYGFNSSLCRGCLGGHSGGHFTCTACERQRRQLSNKVSALGSISADITSRRPNITLPPEDLRAKLKLMATAIKNLNQRLDRAMQKADVFLISDVAANGIKSTADDHDKIMALLTNKKIREHVESLDEDNEQDLWKKAIWLQSIKHHVLKSDAKTKRTGEYSPEFSFSSSGFTCP